MKFKVKKGDEVVVISGDEKGKRGKVLEVQPEKMRVLIEGINMIQKRQKPRKQDDPDAGIVEREAPIHYSNVMLASRYDERQQKKAS
jgi:large subunit ribosomal protein L24